MALLDQCTHDIRSAYIVIDKYGLYISMACIVIALLDQRTHGILPRPQRRNVPGHHQRLLGARDRNIEPPLVYVGEHVLRHGCGHVFRYAF